MVVYYKELGFLGYKYGFLLFVSMSVFIYLFSVGIWICFGICNFIYSFMYLYILFSILNFYLGFCVFILSYWLYLDIL